MDYEKEVLRVLASAGKAGLKMSKITRHVLNSGNSLFEPLDYDEVYSCVRSALRRLSKGKGSPVKCMKRRGYYCIDAASAYFSQCRFEHGVVADGVVAGNVGPDDSMGDVAITDDNRQLSLF